MQIQDVVIKQTDPLRIAEAVGTAPGYGYQNLGPLFARLLPEVFNHIQRAGAKPGISVAHYEDTAGDGSIMLHAGFQIGSQEVPDSDTVSVVELPQTTVASIVHRGTMDSLSTAFEALFRWIQGSDYEVVGQSRELYHEWHEDDPSRHITELQMPIALTALASARL